MRITITIDKYLIDIKYPALSRYQCYECPGALYLEWKRLQLFKYKTIKKRQRLTGMAETIYLLNRASKKYHERFFSAPLYPIFPDLEFKTDINSIGEELKIPKIKK